MTIFCGGNRKTLPQLSFNVTNLWVSCYVQTRSTLYIVETILKESDFREFSLKSSFRLACLGVGIYPQSFKE